MKSTLRRSILLLLMLGVYLRAGAQTPDVAQLLREVQATYGSLQSYSATGEVLSAVVMDSSANPFGGNQPQEFRTSFTVKLARPQMYEIVWEQGSAFFSTKGAVWSDGDSRFVLVGGQVTQPANTMTALAAATGVSGGAAHTIPFIFFDLEGGGIVNLANTAVLAGEEPVDGEACYVVKVPSDGIERTFWISKTSKLIRQSKTVSSGNHDPAEFSDEDAKQVLEGMGQTATPDKIRALRAQMANAQQAVKSIKSSYSIEKHRNIKTNDPMSPEDFRGKPNPN